MRENQYGKKSVVQIRAACGEDRTYPADVYFTAPFKIMKPFYEAGPVMQLMLISVSAGIMAGDTQEIQIHVEQGASLEIRSQSYEKIHRMDEGYASRYTRINLEEGAYLYYNPLPVIPFGDSEFVSDTSIALADETSVLEYKEILSCGRAARGERFQYRRYQNRLQIRLGKDLVYYDHCVFEPSSMNMEGYGLFEGFTHMGTYLVYDRNNAGLLESIKSMIADQNWNAGATRNEHGLVVVKMLGKSGQELEQMMEVMRSSPERPAR